MELLFHEALERGPDVRESWIEQAAAGDEELAREVASLVRAYEEAPEFDDVVATCCWRDATGVLASGTRVGAYRIHRRIASGGMGIVYEAEQENPRRRVALKMLHAGARLDRRRLALFRREARTLARLTHPGIAAVLEAGRTREGLDFLAMELVHGPSIDIWAKRERPAREQRIELVIALCEAVAHAHQNGVIHRDLKPANVLVVPAWEGWWPKVLDFGLARILAGENESLSATVDGRVMGTVAYMSPEQIRGDVAKLGPASDQYAIAVMLYELLTGSLPHDLTRLSLPEAARVRCQEPPRRPSELDRELRGDLDTILLTALDEDPGRRYPSVGELAADLRRYLAKEPIHARPSSALYHARKLIGRHRLVAGLVVAFFALSVGAAVLSTLLWRRSLASERTARAEAASAQHVVDFLNGMLSASDPLLPGRGDVTVRELLDDAARGVDEELADEPVVAARVRTTLGESFVLLGRPAEAIPLLEASLETLRGRSEPSNMARCLGLLGLAHHMLGDYDRAHHELEEALTALDAAPESQLERAWTRGRLGATLRAQGRSDDAERVLRRALVDCDAVANEDPRLTRSAVQVELAGLIGPRGDASEALALLDEAYSTQREILGDEHRWVAETLHERGAIRLIAGVPPEDAVEDLERCEAALIRLVGEDHVELAEARNTLGEALRLSRRPGEAESRLRKALDVLLRELGDAHPSAAAARNNLAMALCDLGRHAEAAPLLEQALSARLDVFGPRSPEVAVTETSLGAALLRLGDLENAEMLLADAVGSLAEVPTRLRKRGDASVWLADVRMARKDYGAAEATLRALLSEPGLGERGLADLRREAGLRLGESLRAQGRFEEAEPVLLEVLASSREDGVGLDRALEWMIVLNEDLGRGGEAAVLRAERLALRDSGSQPTMR